jgi:rhodanese-related sulfurtransferase
MLALRRSLADNRPANPSHSEVTMKARQLLVAACLLAGSASVATVSTPAAAESVAAPEVSLDELKTLVAKKTATIVDANGDKMYKDGHIPGAIHFATAKDKLAKLLPADKNTLVVAYCGGPLCTAWEDAAKEIKALGYKNVKHFKGGIKVWKSSGQQVEKA